MTLHAVEEDARDLGIKSVVVGAGLLHVIATAPRPLSLTHIAREGRMPTSKARRYMVSLLQSGLVAQDTASRLYELGPAALQLGLAAVARFDINKRADPILQKLAGRIDETVGLMIWSPRGPTLTRLIVSNHPIALTMRVGSIIPVLPTASGQVLASHLDPAMSAPLIAAEKAKQSILAEMDEASLFASVRKQGYARIDGTLLRGVTAFAVPVFGPLGEPAAALNVLGRTDSFTPAHTKNVLKALQDAAKEISVSRL